MMSTIAVCLILRHAASESLERGAGERVSQLN